MNESCYKVDVSSSCVTKVSKKRKEKTGRQLHSFLIFTNEQENTIFKERKNSSSNQKNKQINLKFKITHKQQINEQRTRTNAIPRQ